jgi:hypothetical protein
MKTRFLPTLFLTLAVFVSAANLSAGTITYLVTVNTSGFAGDGNIDLQFNPGNIPGADAATAAVMQFNGAAVVGSPMIVNDVTGVLAPDTTVLFDNQKTFNDFFQEVTFGQSLSFLVTFGGTAIQSPSAGATFGSTFSVGLFDNTANQNPLVGADGIAGEIDINPGSSLLTTQVFPAGSPVASISLVSSPEPATIVLAGMALCVVGIASRKKRG